MTFQEFEKEWNEKVKQDVDNLKNHSLLKEWVSGGPIMMDLMKFSKVKKYTRNCKNLEFLLASYISEKYLQKTLKRTGQWTTQFCESLVKYIYDKNYGVIGNIPARKRFIDRFNKKSLQPDLEYKIDDMTYFKEVKARTYTTTGTAGDKILNVPWKYGQLCDDKTKHLHIVCVGFQEYEGENAFQLFSEFDNIDVPFRRRQIELWSEFGIKFVKLSTEFHKLKDNPS